MSVELAERRIVQALVTELSLVVAELVKPRVQNRSTAHRGVHRHRVVAMRSKGRGSRIAAR
jgi:hypothetical protein